MITALFLISGLMLLYFGAEWLVKGSANLALRAGVSSLVVGLTIVAFGTSAPELVVSIGAGMKGLGDISVGNVVGSNIFNIAVILGISALLRPLKINAQLFRVDLSVMIAVSLLLWLLLLDSAIGRIEAAFLAAAVILYIGLTVYLGSRKAPPSTAAEGQKEAQKKRAGERPVFLEIGLIALGLAALVAGSRFFVKGAVELAQHLGISEAVIGLTIVAAGTSLPELATSIFAAVKGEEDIAVGNIIGSNIFNILAILGITGMFAPLSSPGIKAVDMAFMAGTAVVLLPFMRTGFRLSRIEGILLLAIYVGYLWYLWPGN
ncbi:calcium/sodium antiporter [Fibrobacterota bacterium]